MAEEARAEGGREAVDWAMEAVGLAAAVTARVGAGWVMAEAGKVEGGWAVGGRAAVEATAIGGWGWEAAGCGHGGMRGGN